MILKVNYRHGYDNYRQYRPLLSTLCTMYMVAGRHDISSLTTIMDDTNIDLLHMSNY